MLRTILICSEHVPPAPTCTCSDAHEDEPVSGFVTSRLVTHVTETQTKILS